MRCSGGLDKYAEEFKEYICDTGVYLNEAASERAEYHV